MQRVSAYGNSQNCALANAMHTEAVHTTTLLLPLHCAFLRQPSGECGSVSEDENMFDEIGLFLRNMLNCKILMPMFLSLTKSRRLFLLHHPAISCDRLFDKRLRDTVINVTKMQKDDAFLFRQFDSDINRIDLIVVQLRTIR